MAENLEMNLNRVFPGGKLAEVGCLFFFVIHIYLYIQSILSPFQSASRFDLFELVSMGKFFEENVTEFMETKVKDLRPVCNFVQYYRILICFQLALLRQSCSKQFS